MRKRILDLIDLLGFDDNFKSFVTDFTFSDLDSNVFAEGVDLSDYSDLDYLEFALFKLAGLYSEYRKRDISDQVFIDSLADLVYRVNRYYLANGRYGLSAHDMKWLAYIYRMETFALGSLRYRKYHVTYSELERFGDEHLVLSDAAKEVLYEGRNVVYIHIPTGANLISQAVDESLALARVFFQDHFAEFEYDLFISRTWLLYPGLSEFMNLDSNIIKFLDRFEIVASHNNPKQAFARIYGTSDLLAINEMNKTSSLMKSAYLNIDNLGVGIGIIRR